jgi:hypothetical protein
VQFFYIEGFSEGFSDEFNDEFNDEFIDVFIDLDTNEFFRLLLYDENSCMFIFCLLILLCW